MFPEIVRRLVATIPVMGVVAIAVFALLHVTPGDPAVIIAGDYATTEDIAKIRAKLGLDQPFLAQVGIWLGRIVRGEAHLIAARRQVEAGSHPIDGAKAGTLDSAFQVADVCAIKPSLQMEFHLREPKIFSRGPPRSNTSGAGTEVDALAELPGVLHVQARGELVECTVDVVEKRLPEILRWLHEQGVLVRGCEVKEPELEDVFVELAR